MDNATFSESFIRVKNKPKLRKPLLVVGLPGVGFVSKLAVDHLVRELDATHFATLYSPHFPNQVLALKNGRLRAFCMKLYYAKLKHRDVVLLRGDLQPLTVEGQYEVSAKVLAFFRDLGGQDVLSMAGYAVQRQQKTPTIFAYATSKALVAAFQKIGAKPTAVIVPVVGMAGLLPTLSKLYGLRGACLLVETSGQNVDALGAKQLVALLGRFLKHAFNVKALEARAKKSQVMIQRIEQQARQEEASAISPTSLEPGGQNPTSAYIQ